MEAPRTQSTSFARDATLLLVALLLLASVRIGPGRAAGTVVPPAEAAATDTPAFAPRTEPTSDVVPATPITTPDTGIADEPGAADLAARLDGADSARPERTRRVCTTRQRETTLVERSADAASVRSWVILRVDVDPEGKAGNAGVPTVMTVPLGKV